VKELFDISADNPDYYEIVYVDEDDNIYIRSNEFALKIEIDRDFIEDPHDIEKIKEEITDSLSKLGEAGLHAYVYSKDFLRDFLKSLWYVSIIEINLEQFEQRLEQLNLL